MDLIRMLCLAALPATALAVGRGYALYLARGVAECEGFLALLRRCAERISCLLSPICEITADFENDALSRVGFISLIREGKSAEQAYEAVESRLCIGNGTKDILRRAFGDMGKGYDSKSASDRLMLSCTELADHLSLLKTENEKNLKLARSVLLLVSLGLVILFI